MEDSNYAYVKALLDLAMIPTAAVVQQEAEAGGTTAMVLDTADVIPPTKDQAVTGPPQEEKIPEADVKETGSNLPLIGGLIAITAGIGAVYMSRRRS